MLEDARKGRVLTRGVGVHRGGKQHASVIRRHVFRVTCVRAARCDRAIDLWTTTCSHPILVVILSSTLR